MQDRLYHLEVERRDGSRLIVSRPFEPVAHAQARALRRAQSQPARCALVEACGDADPASPIWRARVAAEDLRHQAEWNCGPSPYFAPEQ